jgi:hypothetical protein
MYVRRIITSALPMLALLGLGLGCSGDNVRSTLYVWNINDGDGVTSDVIDRGDDNIASSDDFVYEDEVPITIWNTARDGIVDTGSAYSFVTVERYEVRYESTEEIEGFGGGLGWLVPSRNTFEGVLTIVPGSLKTRAPLIALQNGGEILATAHITFYARESGSNNELTFTTKVPVHFANWADGN